MPAGIFRAVFVASQGTAAAGELTVRQTDGAVFVCHYDAHSYLERDHRPVKASAFQPGDPLEIVADRQPGSSACYLRIVQETYPPAAKTRSAAARFTPKGDRNVAGMVVRVEAQKLTLRTRSGEEILLLRPDTRYLSNGVRTDSAALSVNTRVSVRAGRDIYGNVQAYQVAWGEILDVR